MDYNKMESGHKEKWLFALRSGNYKQGRGHLRQSNGQDVFCCLGVLQDVIHPEDWVKPGSFGHTDDKIWSVPETDKYEGAYDDPALNESEIQDRLMDETSFDGAAMSTLISMNDGRLPPDVDKPRIDTKTFGEIADWIEENL